MGRQSEHNGGGVGGPGLDGGGAELDGLVSCWAGVDDIPLR